MTIETVLAENMALREIIRAQDNKIKELEGKLKQIQELVEKHSTNSCNK